MKLKLFKIKIFIFYLFVNNFFFILIYFSKKIFIINIYINLDNLNKFANKIISY